MMLLQANRKALPLFFWTLAAAAGALFLAGAPSVHAMNEDEHGTAAGGSSDERPIERGAPHDDTTSAPTAFLAPSFQERTISVIRGMNGDIKLLDFHVTSPTTTVGDVAAACAEKLQVPDGYTFEQFPSAAVRLIPCGGLEPLLRGDVLPGNCNQLSAIVDTTGFEEKEKAMQAVERSVDSTGIVTLFQEREDLQNDRDIVMAAVQKYGRVALQLLHEKMWNDRSIVMALVKKNGQALEYAGPDARNDRAIVMAAVQKNPYALRLAGEELRNDREIVMAAVQDTPFALGHAGEELRNDREIVMAAVQENGSALEYASEELRNDRAIVMAAVQKNGRALQHAGEELRNDREIVMAAVQDTPFALGHAGEKMRNDREIVLTAVRKDPFALQYAGPDALGCLYLH